MTFSLWCRVLAATLFWAACTSVRVSGKRLDQLSELLHKNTSQECIEYMEKSSCQWTMEKHCPEQFAGESKAATADKKIAYDCCCLKGFWKTAIGAQSAKDLTVRDQNPLDTMVGLFKNSDAAYKRKTNNGSTVMGEIPKRARNAIKHHTTGTVNWFGKKILGRRIMKGKQRTPSVHDLVREDFQTGGYDLQTFRPLVWTHPIHSELDFSSLVRLTYKSAKSWGLVTSYGCNPAGKFDARATGSALWESFFSRFGDDVDLVFAYNKDSAKQAVFRKTTVSIEDGAKSGWQEDLIKLLVMAGEDEASKWGHNGERDHYPKKSLKARIYMIELDPIGFFGSWHTKFYINDRSLYGTGGWSVGNQAKLDWIDAGVVTIDKGLAQHETDYFVDHMLKVIDGNDVVRKVTYDGPITRGDLSAEAFADKVASGVGFQKVEKKEMNSLADRLKIFGDQPFAADDEWKSELLRAGWSSDVATSAKSQMVERKASPVRNKGSSWTTPQYGISSTAFTRMKPINLAVWSLFHHARPGDTVWLRNLALFGLHNSRFLNHDPVWSWVRAALRKGVNVKILYLDSKRVDDDGQRAQVMTSNAADALYHVGLSDMSKDQHATLRSRLQVRRINYEEKVDGKPMYRDHGKVYALEQKENDGNVLITVGTWNANVQSERGSNENTLFMEERKPQADLFQNFLHKLWIASEAGQVELPWK